MIPPPITWEFLLEMFFVVVLMALTGEDEKRRERGKKKTSPRSLALSAAYFFGLASTAKQGSAVTHSGVFLKTDGGVYYRPIIPAAAFRQSVDMRKYWKMMQCVFTVIGFGGGIQ